MSPDSLVCFLSSFKNCTRNTAHFPPARLPCCSIFHLLAQTSQSKKNTFFFLISHVQSSQLLSGLLILTSNLNVCTYVSRHTVIICCLEHYWPLFSCCLAAVHTSMQPGVIFKTDLVMRLSPLCHFKPCRICPCPSY